MNKSAVVGLTSTIIVSVAVVISAGLFSGAWVRSHSGADTVNVVGSAMMPIDSDLIIWTGTVSANAPDLLTAYKDIKSGTTQVQKYLKSKGIPEGDVTTGSIQSNPLTENVETSEGGTKHTFSKIIGYQLTQQVKVRSTNVALVGEVSTQVTDLLASGVNFQSDPPQYLYTKLGSAKIDILAKAAADAMNRAKAMAESTHAHLGQVRSISVQPLQICPRDNVDISSEGQNDTTALHKTIMGIVRIRVAVG